MYTLGMAVMYYDKNDRVWRTLVPNGLFKDYKCLDGTAGMLPFLEKKLKGGKV